MAHHSGGFTVVWFFSLVLVEMGSVRGVQGEADHAFSPVVALRDSTTRIYGEFRMSGQRIDDTGTVGARWRAGADPASVVRKGGAFSVALREAGA